MLDIMMATFNRCLLTQETLNSLLETTSQPFNLIIVENGSTDDTLSFLENFLNKNHIKIKSSVVIKNKYNLGIATARNQCLAASKSEWLCTLDNDVKLPDNWDVQCIEILKSNKNYGAIGVNFENISYPTAGNNIKFQSKPRGNLGTACMVFPRSLFKMIGYFNSIDYSPSYGLEDSDYGARIRALGLQLGYLLEPGTHLGVGQQDQGEYRSFKTKEHDQYVNKFNENYRLYFSKKKSIYFKWDPPKFEQINEVLEELSKIK